MGSNSNRSETKQESLNRLAGKITRNSFSSSSFQTSTGARIRGIMGVEKGNQFIKEQQKRK